MSKAARNRAIGRIADQATVGRDAEVTRSVARRLRKDQLQGRRYGRRTFNVLELRAEQARSRPHEP